MNENNDMGTLWRHPSYRFNAMKDLSASMITLIFIANLSVLLHKATFFVVITDSYPI
jgi:hypothetical protein